jgi:hypothetical protein
MFIINEIETSHILISIRLYFTLTISITEDELYYGFFLDRQFRGDVAILVFLKTMASYNPSSLTPSLFTEVHVLSAKPLFEALLQIHHHNSFFTTYNKVKKSITSSEKFQKFNRKIVKIGKIDIPNTHIQRLFLFFIRWVEGSGMIYQVHQSVLFSCWAEVTIVHSKY